MKRKQPELGGRWGEVEIEKGPVDLFPAEPAHDVRGTSALRGPKWNGDPTRHFVRKMGRTRSGGPRLCADRSGAEIEPWVQVSVRSVKRRTPRLKA